MIKNTKTTFASFQWLILVYILDAINAANIKEVKQYKQKPDELSSFINSVNTQRTINQNEVISKLNKEKQMLEKSMNNMKKEKKKMAQNYEKEIVRLESSIKNLQWQRTRLISKAQNYYDQYQEHQDQLFRLIGQQENLMELTESPKQTPKAVLTARAIQASLNEDTSKRTFSNSSRRQWIRDKLKLLKQNDNAENFNKFIQTLSQEAYQKDEDSMTEAIHQKLDKELDDLITRKKTEDLSPENQIEFILTENETGSILNETGSILIGDEKSESDDTSGSYRKR